MSEDQNGKDQPILKGENKQNVSADKFIAENHSEKNKDIIEITKAKSKDEQGRIIKVTSEIQSIDESSKVFQKDKEAKPLQHFRLGLLFQDHAVFTPKDYAINLHRLEKDLKKTFVKGEKNIYFLEGGAHSLISEGLMEGKPYHNSYRKAYVHSEVKRQLGISIEDDQELNKGIKYIEKEYFEGIKQHEGGPITLHRWLQYTAADQLIEEGYAVDVNYEPEIKHEHNKQHEYQEYDTYAYDVYLKQYKVGGLAATRKAIEEEAKLSAERNKNIVETINSIANEADTTGKNTNLVIEAGTAHYLIEEMLSNRIRPVASSILRGKTPEELFNKLDKISHEIQRGRQISSREWEEAFYGKILSKLPGVYLRYLDAIDIAVVRGYWRSKEFGEQFKEKAIPFFKKLVKKP
jgi:hypothetical protein